MIEMKNIIEILAEKYNLNKSIYGQNNYKEIIVSEYELECYKEYIEEYGDLKDIINFNSDINFNIKFRGCNLKVKSDEEINQIEDLSVKLLSCGLGDLDVDEYHVMCQARQILEDENAKELLRYAKEIGAGVDFYIRYKHYNLEIEMKLNIRSKEIRVISK
jgi:hypothetical protein